MSSTPTFSEFSPEHIEWQDDFIDMFMCDIDWTKDKYEFLLSGSYGSAKSMIAAHLAVLHCVQYPRAVVLIARKALPDLKETLFKKICEHLEGTFKKDSDYWINETQAKIKFRNGSEIISRSWSDKKYKKMRSLEISAAVVEELTENNEEDMQAYNELWARVGRLSHVPQSWCISCTNPDSPGHWVYKRFMLNGSDTRRVQYSVTTDNPFLPTWYVDSLKRDYTTRELERILGGKWIELSKEVIYYAYSREKNYKDESYVVNPKYPISMCYDFNIGLGKPLSVCFYQYVRGIFHVFSEVVVEGQRTGDSLEEAKGRGLLDYPVRYIIKGDRNGRNKDTRNIRSDYDIIEKYLSNTLNNKGHSIRFEIDVPRSNPPIRKRHNLVNGACENANGDVGLYVYKDAPTVDEGLRLTKLKKGANLIEDDSDKWQHITTALGYGIVTDRDNEDSGDLVPRGFNR